MSARAVIHLGKAMFLVTVVLCSCAMSGTPSAGDSQQDKNEETVAMENILHDRYEGDIPTEQELTIGRDLGISERRLEAMSAEGMSVDEAFTIGQAEKMLAHLADKYGCAFRAIEMQQPELADDTWRLTAEVNEGDLAGQICLCTWNSHDAPNGLFLDDLVSRVRCGELEDYAWLSVERAFGGLQAGGVGECVTATTLLTDNVTLETEISELAAQVPVSIHLYLPPDTSLSESACRDSSEVMSKDLQKRKILASWVVMRLLDPNGRIADNGQFTLSLAKELASSQPGLPAPKEGIDWDWRVSGSTIAKG